MINNIGTNVAAQKARFRRQFGVPVQPLSASKEPAGSMLWMRTRSLEKREREYLPEGLANVADADLRVFEASPIDFTDPRTKASIWPAVDSLWSWHNIRYTLIAVHPGDDEVAGVMITLLLFAYKTPPQDSETTISEAEAAASGQPQEAGHRVAYRPKSTNTVP